MISERLSLCSFDLLKLVDFGAFAVVHAAHALGEQVLKPGIGRRSRCCIGHRWSYSSRSRLFDCCSTRSIVWNAPPRKLSAANSSQTVLGQIWFAISHRRL